MPSLSMHRKTHRTRPLTQTRMPMKSPSGRKGGTMAHHHPTSYHSLVFHVPPLGPRAAFRVLHRKQISRFALLHLL